jgi:hypothetical protein
LALQYPNFGVNVFKTSARLSGKAQHDELFSAVAGNVFPTPSLGDVAPPKVSLEADALRVFAANQKPQLSIAVDFLEDELVCLQRDIAYRIPYGKRYHWRRVAPRLPQYPRPFAKGVQGGVPAVKVGHLRTFVEPGVIIAVISADQAFGTLRPKR